MATGQVQCLFQHPAPSPHPKHHHPHHFFFRSHTRQMEKRTRGPLDTPAQVIWLKGIPYVPTNGSTLRLWFRRQELAPRGKSEAKHHPRWQLTQAFLSNLIKYQQQPPCPNIPTSFIIMELNHRTKIYHLTKHG